MTERKSRPPKSSSDRPPGDLNKERDAFIQTFLKKGVQLTEELLKENERLRRRSGELEAENAMLRAQVKSDTAIRELIQKIQALETEKNLLMSRFHEVEARTDEYASTFAEVEAELANLASLYVASNQLHSTLSLRGVIRQLKEMLAQLVGARSFAIYFVADDGSHLVPIAHEGIRTEQLAAVQVGEGPIGRAFSSGTSEVAEEADVSACSVASPAACVPLRIEERLIGVVAVFSTYEQKTRFLPVDYEFFKLLAAHAASALVAARLFAQGGGKTPGIDSFLDLGV
jgi:putative methionine-R-sulfoxide reductase with GAF domain